MTHQITKRILERKISYLNDYTDSPQEPYTRNAEGKFKANPGNYHLSGAYGGWTLQRMHNEGGGVTTPLNCGYVPKRKLFELICAYMEGMATAKGERS